MESVIDRVDALHERSDIVFIRDMNEDATLIGS